MRFLDSPSISVVAGQKSQGSLSSRYIVKLEETHKHAKNLKRKNRSERMSKKMSTGICSTNTQ
jgi:hypothetical protein